MAILICGTACGEASKDPAPPESPPATDDTTSRDAGGGSTKPGDDEEPRGTDPPPTVPCDDEETANVQEAIDGAHPSETDAVAAIKTACGVRFWTSGPSQTDATKLHWIGSVTKTYVASIVLKLVDEGKLSLDASASTYLPTIPGGTKIKIRHLLSHMSGLAKYEDSAGFTQAVLQKKDFTTDELLKRSFDQGSKFEPGSKFVYTNANFTALGVIAEKVTQKPIAALFEEKLRAPLGIRETFFAGAEPVTGNYAPAKNAQGGDATNFFNPTCLWGAGNVVSTPEAAVTFIEALALGKVVSPASYDAMRTTIDTNVVESVLDRKAKYGLGLMVMDESLSFGGGKGYGHTGSISPGYHSAAFYFPDKKTTVVTVIDYTPSDIDKQTDVFLAVLKALFDGK